MPLAARPVLGWSQCSAPRLQCPQGATRISSHRVLLCCHSSQFCLSQCLFQWWDTVDLHLSKALFSLDPDILRLHRFSGLRALFCCSLSAGRPVKWGSKLSDLWQTTSLRSSFTRWHILTSHPASMACVLQTALRWSSYYGSCNSTVKSSSISSSETIWHTKIKHLSCRNLQAKYF